MTLGCSTVFTFECLFFIQELKAELKLCSHAATDDRETLQTQLLSLTSDLKTTKMALDETIKREKQVKISMVTYTKGYANSIKVLVTVKLFNIILNI